MSQTWPATIPTQSVGHRLITYDAGLPYSGPTHPND